MLSLKDTALYNNVDIYCCTLNNNNRGVGLLLLLWYVLNSNWEIT